MTKDDLISRQPKRTQERTETHACDLISRQAAIDVLDVGAEVLRRVLDDADIVCAEREKYKWGLGLIESCISDIKQLPSAQPEVLACGEGELIAQPEIVRCKDCTFYRSDGCFFSTAEIEEDGFCSWAERKTDEKENI